jgi:hypothetical protein
MARCSAMVEARESFFRALSAAQIASPDFP